jgi:hypothetical protein
MATLDEAMTMMEKGMDPDQILNIIKNTTRTKNATGGLPKKGEFYRRW